jgi:hypothetical protein
MLFFRIGDGRFSIGEIGVDGFRIGEDRVSLRAELVED